MRSGAFVLCFHATVGINWVAAAFTPWIEFVVAVYPTRAE
jgi:hypothetical protein